MILDTNLKNMATTQYLNFDFNSACLFNGSVLLAGDDGLFKLSGDLDNADVIPAYFEPVETDFGISNPKRLRAIYISYESVGELTITVSTDQNKTETFTLPGTSGENTIKKLKPSRSVFGRYYTFNIGNGDNGGLFSIEYIQVVPQVQSHRRPV